MIYKILKLLNRIKATISLFESCITPFSELYCPKDNKEPSNQITVLHIYIETHLGSYVMCSPELLTQNESMSRWIEKYLKRNKSELLIDVKMNRKIPQRNKSELFSPGRPGPHAAVLCGRVIELTMYIVIIICSEFTY